jgi:putative membrane protein
MENFAVQLNVAAMVSTVVYSIIGLALFGLALLLMVKIAPFSIRKEIEEDQNTSLGIIMGSVFIALAIIIQAAMR